MWHGYIWYNKSHIRDRGNVCVNFDFKIVDFLNCLLKLCVLLA